MPEQPGQLCEVTSCSQPAVGSYLHLGGASSVQFAVCEPHLSELKAGARPSVVTDTADPDAGPVLLLGPTAAEPASTGGAHARPGRNGSD